MSDFVPMAAIGVGAYLLWFGVHYWRSSETQYPHQVIKSVVGGGGLPSNASSTQEPSRAAATKIQLSADQGAAATDSGSGAPATSATGAAGSSTTAASGTASANAVTIAKYLMANGYTANGAGGVLADIYGESGFDPEAVGAGSYGLIQWQGSQYADLVTGNASADMDKQLPMIISYNNAQTAFGSVAELNAQTSITAAADYYSQKFERPLVTDSDVSAAGIAAATSAIAAAQ